MIRAGSGHMDDIGESSLSDPIVDSRGDHLVHQHPGQGIDRDLPRDRRFGWLGACEVDYDRGLRLGRQLNVEPGVPPASVVCRLALRSTGSANTPGDRGEML